MKAKLLVAAVVILLGFLFALQNSAVVEIRFLFGSVHMSLALVIFLAGAAGLLSGFLLGTAARRRKSD